MHKSCSFLNIYWIAIILFPTFQRIMAGFLRVLSCAPGGIVLQSIENFAIQNFVAHSAFLIVFLQV